MDILSYASSTTAAPAYEYVAPAPVFTDLESVLEPPIPVVHTALAPVIDHAALASTGTYATPAPVIEHAAPAHTVTFTAPSPVTEDVAPAPAVTYAAPAPVIEYVAPATPETVNAHVAPAPVIEYIALSPAVFYPSFSQQMPPFNTNDVVAVDVSSLLPSDEQIVDIRIPRSMEEIVEEQIVDALVPQTVEEQFVAVTPTLATTDDDPIPPILDDEQMLLGCQAQIDQCVHMLTRLCLIVNLTSWSRCFRTPGLNDSRRSYGCKTLYCS